MATLQAIEMCCDRRFTKVHFEGDAKNVTEAVKGAEIDESKLGHLVEDMRVKLQTFPQWKMSYVKRTGNQAAHCLSRFAIHQGAEVEWTGTPHCIHDIIRLEHIAPVQ
jgi:ribonuclease HI